MMIMDCIDYDVFRKYYDPYHDSESIRICFIDNHRIHPLFNYKGQEEASMHLVVDSAR